MKFLLTNDDGIDAPGLEALSAAVRSLGACLTVAPTEALSGCSHQLTVARPLRLQSFDAGRYALDGTPADCVRVALWHLDPEIDCVLSGINAGGNLGADIYPSGTVAAAREAALLGKPAIAFSQYRRRAAEIDWSTASQWAALVLQSLLPRLRQSDGRPALWNVNFPHLDPGSPVPEIAYCPLDPHSLPVHFVEDGDQLYYRARYQDRERAEGCDVERCFGGQIAVTDLSLPRPC